MFALITIMYNVPPNLTCQTTFKGPGPKVSVKIKMEELTPICMHFLGTWRAQGQIQEFILGGPNQVLESKVEGEARVEGNWRRSLRKTGRSLGRGAQWAPRKMFEKLNLKPFILVHTT